MNKFYISLYKILYIFLFLCFYSAVSGQKLNINDFAIFAGQKSTSLNGVTNPLAPGFSVNIGSSANINGGHIGSYNLVNSTANSVLNCDINSGGSINLANGTTVNGNISAQNLDNLAGVVLSIGSNAYIKNNNDGNINKTIGNK